MGFLVGARVVGEIELLVLVGVLVGLLVVLLGLLVVVLGARVAQYVDGMIRYKPLSVLTTYILP